MQSTKSLSFRAGQLALILILFLVGLSIQTRGLKREQLSVETKTLPLEEKNLERVSTLVTKEIEHLARDDPPFVPPDWIREYIAFHKSRIKENQLINGARALQYHCLHGSHSGYKGRCGGLGDRLKGILTGFLSSVSDNRVFLIDWDDVTPLSDYLAPAHINWLAQPTFDNTKKRDWVWLNKDKRHPMVINPCELRSNASMVMYRCMYFRSQRRMNTSCVQSFFKEGIVTDTNMFNNIFWTLFQWTDRTKEAARRLLGPVNPKYFVGVHIRTGGNSTSFVDQTRHSTLQDIEAFSSCATLVQKALEEKCGKAPAVYVMSDNHEAKKLAKKLMVKDGVDVHASDVEVYHIDRSNVSLIEDLTSANDAVWGEFKILMDATCLVVGVSGFSHLGQHMSRHQTQPRCAVYFNKCTEEKVRMTVEKNAIC